jgi:hypothetical protein
VPTVTLGPLPGDAQAISDIVAPVSIGGALCAPVFVAPWRISLNTNRRFLSASAILATALLSACSGLGTSSTPQLATRAAGNNANIYVRTLRAPLGANSIVSHPSGASQPLCKPSGDTTRATCFASVLTSGPATGPQSTVPGVTPWDLSYIYNYPAPGSQSQTNETIGIVVAYDAPNAESDLATYRSHFGLPACTTSDGCFTKIMVASAASGGAARPRRVPSRHTRRP